MYRLSPLETWGFPASCIGLRRGHDWAPTFKAALCFIAVAQCSVLGTSGCYRVLCGVSVAQKTGTCGAPLEIGRRIRNFCLKQGKWQAISVFRHDGSSNRSMENMEWVVWSPRNAMNVANEAKFPSSIVWLPVDWSFRHSRRVSWEKLLACLCFQDS